MDNQLRFVDIFSASPVILQRKTDLTSFEKTFKAEIISIHRLTERESLFHLQILDPVERNNFTFRPGQFLMLELPGIGEAPFSISSAPSRKGNFELCIRNVGNLTGFLFRISRGAFVGIRGPFGTSFPMEDMHGQNVLLVAGGLGIAPLRAPIAYVQENRSRFGNVDIIYGTKHASQLLFTYEYDNWRKDDIDLAIVVEKPDASWKGAVGMTTNIIEEMMHQRSVSYFSDTYAIVCGPPVMFKFVCNMLTKANVPMQKMFVSLERRMHCGMGKCCRCNVGSTYTCLNGPVFDYWTVMNLKEAI